jgi:hypothetical protein
MKAEGFMLNSATTAGRVWKHPATVVANARAHDATTQRGELVFVETHGCAELILLTRQPASVEVGLTRESPVARRIPPRCEDSREPGHRILILRPVTLVR